MTGFDLWNKPKEGEEKDVEYLRVRKLSGFDRLMFILCLVLLVVLAGVGFEGNLPSHNHPAKKNTIPDDHQQIMTTRCSDDSPYGC
jgi:hypothetical protein